MTFPHCRLVIFSALIMCGIFTGSCRAEIDVPCPMFYSNAIIEDEGDLCFSYSLIPSCPKMCHPSDTVRKNVSFSCVHKDNLSDKRSDRGIDIFIPVNCELVLPAAVQPGTMK